MARFLRSLDLSIAEKVELQPYWTFEDVCKLAIKVKKHSKNRRPFSSSYSQPSTQVKHFAHRESETKLKEDKGKDKGKGIFKEFPKKLDGKTCFKCQWYGNF